jgi:hypothetical protein
MVESVSFIIEKRGRLNYGRAATSLFLIIHDPQPTSSYVNIR